MLTIAYSYVFDTDQKKKIKGCSDEHQHDIRPVGDCDDQGTADH
jgi:hypothetical protein